MSVADMARDILALDPDNDDGRGLLAAADRALGNAELETLSMAMDVTERRQAEETLAYQVRLLENLNDAVIASDERFVTTAWNRAAEAMYGWTAEEIIGRPTAELLKPEFVGVEPDEVFRRLLEEGSFEGEVIHPRKDGTRIHTEARAMALRNRDGHITGFVSIDRDITDRKRAEERERLRELAAETIRAHEEERQWAAIQVHDRISQTLVGLVHHIEAIDSMTSASSKENRLAKRAARVHLAMEHLTRQGLRRVNLTDEDAQLMKGRQGVMPAYNAQTIVSPLDPAKASGSGMLITAADVVNTAVDSAQLSPMLEESEEMTGVRVPVTLADGGYHTAKNLEAGARRGDVFVMPERYHPGVQGPYFKDRFIYDATTDSYVCPQGGRLPFRGIRRNNGKIPGPFRVYRASRTVCRACPAYGVCTKDKHSGRALWIGPSDALLRKLRQWMATEQAQTLYARRKGMIEPAFGIIKEQPRGRRFLLRGLDNVRSEFTMLATAFNLRVLWRVRAARQSPRPLTASPLPL